MLELATLSSVTVDKMLEPIHNSQFRIIDANLNRIGEGLRFLEDIARLTLDDKLLTEKLKTIRHKLIPTDWAINQQLLQARDAGGDVGAALEVKQQRKEGQLHEKVVANSRRLQQSLRVIEEMAKTPAINLEPGKYQQARFDVYTLERELLSRLLRKRKCQHISGLYAIIDTGFLRGRTHTDVAVEVIKGGAGTIQLRDKITPKRELLAIAEKLQKVCADKDILFIINDHLDIALAAGADGLHLGQQDLPVRAARNLLPFDRIIGCSVANSRQAIAAASAGADYVATGAIYPTSSKEKQVFIGLEAITAIKKAVTLPLVAIGGINQHNAATVVDAGADSVAVISAIMSTDSPEASARLIVDEVKVKE